MKSSLYLVLIAVVLTSLGCSSRGQKEAKRYKGYVNKLTVKLRKQQRITRNLKDENLVLRQLAGVPEPAIKRVRKEGKKDLRVYSEKFLYGQVIKAFKSENRVKLSRSLNVFLEQYPKSRRADNAIYYKALLDLRSGRLAESLEEFDRVLDKYPKANKRPAATLGKGLAYKALNLSAQARMLFETVVKKYPKTSESIRAKRELRNMDTKSL